MTPLLRNVIDDCLCVGSITRLQTATTRRSSIVWACQSCGFATPTTYETSLLLCLKINYINLSIALLSTK